MKMMSVIVLSLVISSLAQAGGFDCSNPPQSRWGEYYSVHGDVSPQGTLSNVNYGTMVGSMEAGQAEPSVMIEFKALKPQSSLQATSSQWKSAYAYDVTTRQLGQATFFLQPSDIKKGTRGTARLKVWTPSGVKNVNLPCRFSPLF